MEIHFADTQYGFEYGAAEVERLHSNDGRVWLGVKTPREELQIYITKTGLIRTSRPKS